MEDKRADSVDMEERTDLVAGEPDDKMECDEPLSGSESVEMTEDKIESSDKMAGIDNKSEPSATASDSTSGIEVKSESSTSQESTSTTTASEECTVAAAATAAPPTSSVAAECSPPPKQGIIGTIIKYLSPTKKDHDKSSKEKSGSKSKVRRSKSMSPQEKSVASSPRKEQKESVAENAGEQSDEKEETFKKGSEKKGVMKTVKAAFAKIIPKSKSTTLESETLVTNEEGVEKAAAVAKPKEKEPSTDDTEDVPGKLYWTKGRQSLTERPSISGTLMTDITSTSSGSDVSGLDSVRRPSDQENISVEAVAGSQPSTPEQMSDIQSDKVEEKDTEMEHVSAKDEEVKEDIEPEVKEVDLENTEMESKEPQNDQKPQTEE